MTINQAEARRQAIKAHQSGDLARAARVYARYLARFPDDAGIWSNLGALNRSAGRHVIALRAHERATALAPNDIGLLNNYANTLSDIGQYDASIEIRRRILTKTPDALSHHAMIGRCLRGKGEYAKAAEHLEAAIEKYPDDAELHLQLAFACLGLGDYARGFDEYVARWNAGELKPRDLTFPQWQGEALEGKTITVLPEQGFGDAVLFMRFLSILKGFGGRVRLAAERPMQRLFQDLEGVDEVVPVTAEGPVSDVWVNMMDLAKVHFAKTDTIPAPSKLHIPEDSTDRARSIVAPHETAFKIGVVWTGSATYKGNAFRSFTHNEYLPLADIPNVQLFSLYKGPFLKEFYADGADAVIIDAAHDDLDFADCAALMKEMDLIITSDTATAHVAGSLGLTTWVVLHWDPFWVWTHAGETTPWYPSIRLFRQQTPLNWTDVMIDVHDAVSQIVKEVE